MRRSCCPPSVVALFAALGACGSPTAPAEVGECPVKRVEIVVTVDQWGDLVRSLSGACGHVTSIVTGSTGDPHDYTPTPADGARFSEAAVVVKNGLGYDAWADKAIDALSHRPAVVDAGRVVGASNGDNPHRWYSPNDVDAVANSVTATLSSLAPNAASFFAERREAWRSATAPIRAAVALLRGKAIDRSYAATEPVFDLMAAALGMTDATPEGFRRAEANGSDPAPADIAALEKVLKNHGVAVLIFNTQTSSPIATEIRHTAQNAKVPVVDVSETVKAGMAGFVDWQVAQLDALTQALP